MWYYLSEYFKWLKGKPKPSPQEEALGEIIRRRAEEQKSVIEREPIAENPTPEVDKKDYLK